MTRLGRPERQEPDTATVDVADLSPGSPGQTQPGDFTLVFASAAGLRVVALAANEEQRVGRASPAEIVIDDRSLSRTHARLRWQPDGVHVEDLGSKNGMHLNGAPVREAVLHAGAAERLQLGNVRLSVRCERTPALAGFDDGASFLARLDLELARAQAFGRPLSLIMLRACSPVPGAGVARRIRKELRAVDGVTEYASNVLLVQAPELGLRDAVTAARWLVRSQAGEPALVCGVASSEHVPGDGPRAAQLIEAVSGACRIASEREPVVAAGEPAEREPPGSPLIHDPKMQALYALATRVASHAAPVLILGETGTGKELVARHIHGAGSRSGGPFVALNCGALPRELLESTLFGHERGAFTGARERRLGAFEEAHGGSLFLDEIGELPLAAQAALLRVLETRQLSRVGSARTVEVDVRVISATHCDLAAMVRERSFRADLFHRLNMITLSVPPLRERVQEIGPLAQRFLELAQRAAPGASAAQLSGAVLERLQRHDWPGNVRELRNVIERAVLLGSGSIDVADLPAPAASVPATPTPPAGPGGFAEQRRSHELQMIRDALQRTQYNQTKAARLLEMPLRTLVYKIRAYGLRSGDH